MRILVTGGAGFIGSNFVRHVLATSEDEVVVYDALTYAGNRSTVADLEDDPRFRFVVGDIRDPAATRAALSGVDAIVHFAAESHVDNSIA
ncbi:MAG TPA: GDP-mannose 4,6-dehydratase, partial [Acidimicrobiales bacterium]